jgi:hypothetical protein
VLLRKQKKMVSARKFEHNFEEKIRELSISVSIMKTSICVCKANVTVSRKYIVERHFMAMHEGYVNKYPDCSEMHRNKVKDLIRNLRERQSSLCLTILTKPKRLALLRTKSQNS